MAPFRSEPNEDRVAAHYGRGGLAEALDAALETAGLTANRLLPGDLAPVDEFHMGGRTTTRELVDAMGLSSSMHVLDVGCGLGGPARHVAADVGCRVTGLDLVDEYVDVARHLSHRCGLHNQVEFRQGSALELPFEDGSFDAAFTQHACMNIEDKARVYSEVHRVLRPGAAFGVFDAMRGPGGPPRFPVPWAEFADTSFLATPAATSETLVTAGFDVHSVADRTDACIRFFERMRDRPPEVRGPLGLHLPEVQPQRAVRPRVFD